MNISAPNPLGVVKAFSQVQSDLSRMDGNLTQWESNGRTYPNSSVQDTFRQMAYDLDDATLSLKDLHPKEKGIQANLKRDILNLGFDAGMTGSMYQSSSTFGSGWSRDLDSSIEDARQAIDLASTPATPSDDPAPNPLKVLKNASDVQADLTRWDANFQQWENNGRIYPNSSVSKDVLAVAGDLYDLRDALRTLHPEQTELLSALQKDIIKVASNAGSTRHMNNHSTTFGSGWGASLDKSIADVRKAIDVLTAGA